MIDLSISIEFQIGDMVYLRTDSEQFPLMVTGIMVRHEHILYGLSQDTRETSHYSIEISRTRNTLMSLGVDGSTEREEYE
jgi:hypothetical protein